MSGASDPIAALLVLADSVNRGEAVPAPVARWLTGAVRGYLNGDGGLDELLGLRGRHWPAATRRRYTERNRHLQEAFTLVGDDPHALTAAISEFRGIWPRWRGLDAAPAKATAIQSALWRAFATGVDIPSSSRQLKRIIGQ